MKMMAVEGSKGSKKQKQEAPHVPIESPNSLRSVSRGRILDLIAHGPIFGLADGYKSVFLDNTPMQNADGTYNFQGAGIIVRNGYPDQSVIPGFRSVESPVDIGVAMKYNSPLVRSISNDDADAVLLVVQVNALSRQEENGDVLDHQVTIRIETKKGDGAWTSRITDTITGKCANPYQRTYRVNLGGGGPWQVRLSRVSADETSQRLQSSTFWSGMTEVIDRRFSYPDSALVGIELDAQLFGNQMPSRSYDMKLSIISVPSNYNPDTRTYTGIWDGTFKQAWTDNPAWAYYDLATHPVIGAGLKKVDKWELYKIGKYCDELVPDGYGGKEPRFTLNALFADRSEAITTLTTLASVFRGMTYWSSNTVVAVGDMPSDVFKYVVPANVIDGDFEYQGTALKERHSVVIVMWNDPKDSFKSTPEFVEDPEMMDLFGWRETQITAFGCSSRGQAHRLGKWILYSEKMETETITYTAIADHADVRPGQIIAVHDPERAGARLGGRLNGANDLSVITLDKVPPETSSGSWFLNIVLADGTLERKPIGEFQGNTVILKEPLSSMPLPSAVWILSSLETEYSQYRVVGVDEADDDGSTFRITATEYNPDKYAIVERNLSLPEPVPSMIPSGPLPPPVGMNAVEYLYKQGVAVKSGVTLSITAGDDPRIVRSDAQVIRPGALDYEQLPFGVVTFDVPDVVPGSYAFRVRSVDGIGGRSAWISQTFYMQGLLKPPSDVTDLRMAINGGQLMLSWPPVPDLDLDHYVIKYSPVTENPIWAQSIIAVERVPAGNTSVMLPARRGSYLIKAVDTSGQESLNAVYAVSTIADLVNVNVVEFVDEGPGWFGTHENTAGPAAGLQLAPIDTISSWLPMSSVEKLSYAFQGVRPSGIYTAQEIVDMGAVYTARLTGNMQVSGYDLTNVIASWLTLASTARMDDSQVGQWGAELQVSYSMTPAGSPPTDWTDWQPLSISEYTARAFRFRVLLSTEVPTITPVVSNMGITVDVPDRVAGEGDLTCPMGGMHVSFDPPFMVRPSLAVDPQGMLVGDIRLLTNITAEGFDLQFLDIEENPVSRTFDYLAKGYGYRVIS